MDWDTTATNDESFDAIFPQKSTIAALNVRNPGPTVKASASVYDAATFARLQAVSIR